MNAKLIAAAQIIKNETLIFLANKHGITVDQVVAEIKAGNVRAAEQFEKLVKAGIAEAMKLAENGQISLN